MIKIDKPTAHHQQLNFNLDAPSPSTSSLSGPYTPPPFILVQKVANKPIAAPQRRDVNVSVPSNRLSLAIQLAKLDVSNAEREEKSEESVCCKPKLVKLKPGQKVQSTKPQFVSKVSKPSKITRSKEYKDNFTQAKPLKGKQTTAQNYHVGKSSKMKEAAHDYAPSVQFVGSKPFSKHHLYKPTTKDAVTSTADLDTNVSSNHFSQNTALKEFARSYDGMVKKEKLQRRFNQRAPNKSGFLSEYRSPDRMKIKNPKFVKSKTLIPKDITVPTPKYFPQKHTVETAPYSSVSNSPPIKLPRPEFFKPAEFQVLNEPPLRGIDEAPLYKSSTQLSSKRSLRTKEKHKLKARPEQITEQPELSTANANKSLVDDILDNIVDDTAKQLHSMGVEAEQEENAQDLQRGSTYETLYQRIIDIENDEKMIRSRWRDIKYDDILPPKRKSFHSLPEVSVPHDDNSQLIHITGGESRSNLKAKDKKVVQFGSRRKNIKQFSEGYSVTYPSISTESKINRTKLTLQKNTIDSIKKGKQEFRGYLNKVFHEPKGNFNPWKIAEDLSADIVSRIISNVCDEVNEGFEGCVEQLFEAEFAQPNQSAFLSELDQSSRISAYANGSSKLNFSL